MPDDTTITESDLTKFFEGLEARLKSFRDVRLIYDEQVAFDFNSTSFFRPKETKTSEILAFFLNPEQNHGQKVLFLKVFKERFNLQMLKLELLEDRKAIKVATEHPTPEKRKIDIAILFGKETSRFSKCKYAIGIENKIGTAADRKGQLEAYAKDLSERVGDGKNWVLFYLTPTGNSPSEISMNKADQDKWLKSGNLRLISYDNDIIGLFEQFEIACRAESVRAFLKDFRQYIKQEYRGETVMGESEFTKTFLKSHPKFLKLVPSIKESTEQLLSDFRKKCFEVLRDTLAKSMRKIQINPSNWQIGSEATLSYENSALNSLMEGVSPKRKDPLSITIDRASDIGIRFEFTESVKERPVVELFRGSMMNSYSEYQHNKWWELGFVALPRPLVDLRALAKFYEDGNNCEEVMKETCEFIVNFVNKVDQSAVAVRDNEKKSIQG